MSSLNAKKKGLKRTISKIRFLPLESTSCNGYYFIFSLFSAKTLFQYMNKKCDRFRRSFLKSGNVYMIRFSEQNAQKRNEIIVWQSY